MEKAFFSSKESNMITGLFNAVAIIYDVPTVQLTENALSVRTMDPSRVCMVDLKIQRAFFDEWIPSDLRFCLDLTYLLKLLKRARKDDLVKFEINPKDEKLYLGMSNEKTCRSFTLSLLEPEDEDPPTPNIEFTAKFLMPVRDLQQLIDDAFLASDHIRFEVENDLIKASSKGDLTSMEAHLPKESDAILDLKVTKPCKAIYTLSYLQDIVKACSKVSDLVTIELGEDLPMKISFSTYFEGKLDYYLAPRIEVE